MGKSHKEYLNGLNDCELISIIVPVYNNSVFLGKCLLSLLNQSYKNIEIIVVDDGSNDQSKSICEKFCKKDQRIKLLYTCHIGPAGARNKGIDESNGEYLCFVDSDDWLPRTAIEKLYYRISASAADFCYGNYTLIETLYMKKISVQTEKDICIVGDNSHFIDLLRQMSLGPCWKLYKSRIIKKYSLRFPVDVSLGEDQMFNLHYLIFCKKIAIEDSSVYYYNRLNNISLTRRLHLDFNKWAYEMASEYAQLFDREGEQNRDEISRFITEKFFCRCFDACQQYAFFEKEIGMELTDEKIIETIELFQMQLRMPLTVDDGMTKIKQKAIINYLETGNSIEFKNELKAIEYSFHLPAWKKFMLRIIGKLKILYYFKLSIHSYLD